MRTLAPALEDRTLRLGAGLSGLVFLAGALLAWQEAQAHMARLGTICGAGIHPHCGWCYGAASLVLAGLAAIVYAAHPNSNKRLRQIKAAPTQA